MSKIQVGIVGYGNLGRGVETALMSAPDMTLSAIFTRRDPASIHPLSSAVSVRPLAEVETMKGCIDVLIICAGSATDLPEMTPALARSFNVVDSYDHHALIQDHYAKVDAVARENQTLAIISAGWDPGLFSINRVSADAVFPNGVSTTFWGKGVSQGHSDALRRVSGVLDARQYTIPIEDALRRVRSGDRTKLTTREKHVRECFVVAEKDADLNRIEAEIKAMPGYFADYDTTVHFITQAELDRDHRALPHGGSVIHAGTTGAAREHHCLVEFHVEMDSNPEFTGAILVAYARAVVRMHQRGMVGCRTVLDVAPSDLSPLSGEELRRKYL